MKALYRYSLLILLYIAFLTGCVEPYAPPVIESDTNYLVVDGFVNSTDGTATVKLSRAIPLSSTDSPPAETNATIFVEDDKGNRTALLGDQAGNYTGSGIPIDMGSKYRLRVRTFDTKEYLSDYIELKESPPIDDLKFIPGDNSISIVVSTHDDTGDSRYYQWSYDETWEYTAVYVSGLIWVDGEIIDRPYSEYVHRCWRTTSSKHIIINSSEKLQQDMISEFPVVNISKGSQKLFIKYSMLLKQRVLTREAYDYWEELQKTTESLGGLFDPQPGKVTGNIHNVSDTGEPVLGYFSGGSVQEKRFFIGLLDLPDHLKAFQTVGNCTLDTLLLADVPNYYPDFNELIGTANNGPILIGYTYSSKSCADCRTQGGTTTKPAFWQ
ncbi:DUF4249 domain-containing protein [Ohtaekwangia kribbensis]|jgi:hypothetical protein|uniref:DUF4249 domain-containing protein n=1 Tax=Ohtaekwangia kribbensis TaxID=688913 RepID=A0ABW3K3D7_9BACT